MITKKKFLTGKFEGKKDSVDENSVDKFLMSNKGFAFRATEIAKKIGKKPNTVRSRLRKLRIAKKLLHTTPYYAWK